MSMDNIEKRFLVIVDNSYMQYFTIFGAVSDFQRECPDEAAVWIKPVEECDQESLPDLLGCQSFRRILKKYYMKRLETIDDIVNRNFEQETCGSANVDVLFACDDKLKRSFRLDLYPQYKANRLAVKRPYRLGPIKDYIENVLRKELELENGLGYRFVKTPGAEGDDVIAVALTSFQDRYSGAVLISSDRDFL